LNAGSVSVISTATNTVTATISVGTVPNGLAITPDGAFAYVTYFSAVAVISTSTNTVVATVPVPGGETVAITPNGAYAYVVCASCGNLSVIATATNTVVATISDPPGPLGIAISPNGALAYVTNPLSYSVLAISTATNTVVDTIDAGNGGDSPQDVAFTPNGAFAYITYYIEPGIVSVVSVVETATNTVVATIPVGNGPVGIAITPAPAAPPQILIGDYGIPTATSFPQGITEGPDGALWFTEFAGNKIGRITAAGVTTEYPVPTSDSGPSMIAPGPDGALWFTEYYGSKIGRITTAGVITEYATTFTGSGPAGITTGSNGELWFTEFNFGKIAEISTAGVIKEFFGAEFPIGITHGPDGALWFTEYPNAIGRFGSGGVVTMYPVRLYSYPEGITTGPDGALWFTESTLSGSAIGRITTGGVLTEYPLPTFCAGPKQIAAGPDHALWFTESGSTTCAPQIGRITTAGVVTEYPMPATGSAEVVSAPFGIASGPYGALWFTDQSANKIGQAVFPTADLSVSPESGAYGTDLTFTGSGFAGGESVSIYTAGIGSSVLATGTANSSGSFIVSTAQQAFSPFGPRLFFGVGQTSKKLGAASYSVTPLLAMNPNSGTTGSTITAQGYGFGSDENVMIYWTNPYTLLGVATATVNGSFTGSAALSFTIPAGAPAGTNYVSGVGETTGAVGIGPVTVP
jgi:virginiamycin B lyase